MRPARVGRVGLAVLGLAALWCWGATVLRHARPWAAWMPAGLVVMFLLGSRSR